MKRVIWLICLLPLLGGCVSNAEGRLIRADMRALEAKYQVMDLKVQDNRNAIDRSIKRVDVKLAELEKTLEKARKLLRRNNANFGQDMVTLQTEFQKISGKSAEATHLLKQMEKEIAEVKKQFDEVKANVTTISYEKKEQTDQASGTVVNNTPKKEQPKEVKPQNINSAGKLFNVAYKMMVDRNFSESLVNFNQLIKKFPTHKRAGSARYWITQIHFATGDYKQAFFTMDSFLQKYPKSKHIPQILYQMGYAARALKLSSDAAELFRHLIKYYPKSSYASKAKELLKKINKGGK